MPIRLIIATDSLQPPLTGIGYYTAHLIDELLKQPDQITLEGLSHHGMVDRDSLAQQLVELTQGELGQQPTIIDTGIQNEKLQSTEAQPTAPTSIKTSGQPVPFKRRLKELLKKVPGAYFFAKLWYARRNRKILETALTIEKHATTLIHAPNYIAPTDPSGTSSVITIHDLSHLRHPETHPKERLDWLDIHLPKAIAQASNIISVSEFTKQELLDLGLVSDPNKIHVCYNGLDASFKPRPLTSIKGDLDNWGLTDQQYILSVATLEPRKNMTRLLDAYCALPEDTAKHYPLVLSGTAGWKNRALRQRIAKIKPPYQVITTGYLERQELQHLLCGAKLFAYISIYEGFGLPIVEAMASGTPVLTANNSSLTEVAAEAAMQVDPLNVADIKQGLLQLLTNNNQAEQLRALGLKRAAEFSWQRCASETVAVYQQTLRESASPVKEQA